MGKFNLPHDGVRRPPMRTFKELAEEFGVTTHKLGSIMARHPGHPEPTVHSRSHAVAHHSTYYNPIQMRAWWATIPDEEKKMGYRKEAAEHGHV